MKKQAAGSPKAVNPLTGAGDGPKLVTAETSSYVPIYNDIKSGAHKDVTIWRPIPTDPSYFIVGDYAQDNYDYAVGSAPLVKAVNDDPDNPLIKRPTGYREVWNDHGTGTKQDCSIWYPTPPDGYVSVGYVANNKYDKPALDNYACLRHDLVGPIDPGAQIWNDLGSGAKMDVALYEILDVPNVFLAKGNYEPNAIPRNDFRLVIKGLSNVSFEVTDHFVTEGQQWDGVTCQSDEQGATITAKAGRHGSKDAAEWFSAAMGKHGSAIGCQTIDKMPGKLNFAFKGTLRFVHRGKQYRGMNIVLGQGHTGFLRNNWWIGGPTMVTALDGPWGILSVALQPFVVKGGEMPLAGVAFVVIAFSVSSMRMVIADLPAMP